MRVTYMDVLKIVRVAGISGPLGAVYSVRRHFLN